MARTGTNQKATFSTLPVMSQMPQLMTFPSCSLYSHFRPQLVLPERIAKGDNSAIRSFMCCSQNSDERSEYVIRFQLRTETEAAVSIVAAGTIKPLPFFSQFLLIPAGRSRRARGLGGWGLRDHEQPMRGCIYPCRLLPASCCRRRRNTRCSHTRLS